MVCEALMSPSCALGLSGLAILNLTDWTSADICSATAWQWLMSCDCDASFLLVAPAPCAAAMSWVDTAAVCLAATSRRRISFFLRALDAAALQAALKSFWGGGGDKNWKSVEIILTYCKATLVYVWKNYANPSKRAYQEIYAILSYAF